MAEPARPPRPTGAAGETRKVGIEIEFAGVQCGRAAEVVASVFGGAVTRQDTFRYNVGTERYGAFRVELDIQLVHAPEAQDALENKAGGQFVEDVRHGLREAVGEIGSTFIPAEVVAPPVPYDELGAMDDLARALRAAGAAGTGEALMYAFGLHLNPECASLEPDYLLTVLRAYLLAEDWLRQEIHLDRTRRLLPFADPFPAAYVRLVADPGYAPDFPTMVDDYIEYNPTRNRGLDMLPVFGHIDGDFLRSRLDERRVSTRPAFHYRLPNASPDDPDWSIVGEWNRWVVVEKLADRPELMAEMGRAYLDGWGITRPFGWPKRSAQWLVALS